MKPRKGDTVVLWVDTSFHNNEEKTSSRAFDCY